METVEKKLLALSKVQEIDSQLDELIKVRGDLPVEVQDLEDELAGLQTRLQHQEEALVAEKNEIEERKEVIRLAEKLIAKYNDQQMKVRNNREYDAITKEVELQELEVKVSEKKIKEGFVQVDLKNQVIEETKVVIEERKKDLERKKEELKVIVEESQEEEDKLNQSRKKALSKIEDSLQLAYNKLRQNARNGLAVVDVKRDACGGCFNMVPLQRQADIREKKKIIVCEHCGRILANVQEVEVPEKPAKRRVTRKKKETA